MTNIEPLNSFERIGGDRITHAVALAKHMISFERRQDAVSVGDHDPERAA